MGLNMITPIGAYVNAILFSAIRVGHCLGPELTVALVGLDHANVAYKLTTQLWKFKNTLNCHNTIGAEFGLAGRL